MHPYPLEKLHLQSKITGKLGRQLNVGNWTEDQALWQMSDQALGGREPKLRIVLTNIDQYRCINDPSHLFLLAFPQFRKHLVRAALRKTVLLGEIQSSHRPSRTGRGDPCRLVPVALREELSRAELN